MSHLWELTEELSKIGLFVSAPPGERRPRLLCATGALHGNSCQVFWEGEGWVICTWAPVCYRLPAETSAAEAAVVCADCLKSPPPDTRYLPCADFDVSVVQKHTLELVKIPLK